MKQPIKRSIEVSFTRAQLQWLEKRFTRRIHFPGTTMEAIMFESGQQAVIQAVRENTAGLTYGETINAS